MPVPIIAMFVNPNVNQTFIQGLMKFGLFPPDISRQNTEVVASNSTLSL